MIALPPAVSRIARACLAMAFAVSWLALAGLPADAAVVDASVKSPKAGATLRVTKPLEVTVERSQPPQQEKVTVNTRMLYGATAPQPDPNATEAPDDEQTVGPQPISKKVLSLKQQGKEKPVGATGTRYQMLFAGLDIDPYNLAWLPRGGVAPNGPYTLEYQAVSDGPIRSAAEEWRRFQFTIDAPAPPQPAPGLYLADVEAKKFLISWQPNAAPDISRYVIDRRKDGGDWKTVKDQVPADKTQVIDKVPNYGTYQYRVTAVRPAGDGSGDPRTATSQPSREFALTETYEPGTQRPAPAPGSGGAPSGGSGSGTSLSPGGSVSGFGTQTEGPESGSGAPDNFDDTYRGPLDYGVEPKSVTERVPVDMAESGTAEDSTLKVLTRSIDQERVLPPVAGGLILVVSAAHVMRYLNE